jgi:hypothetical protein
MMARSVQAGAKSEARVTTSLSRYPTSANVGTEGSIGCRILSSVARTLSLPLSKESHGGVGIDEHHVDLTGNEILQRLRRLAVGHIDQIDACRRPKQFRRTRFDALPLP